MISTSSPERSWVTSGRIGAVDLGADAGVADVGVERIGEIDRRGAARQRDQPAARGEAEHLVLEQLELGVFEEILGRGAGGQVLDGLAQPAHRPGFRSRAGCRSADAPSL